MSSAAEAGQRPNGELSRQLCCCRAAGPGAISASGTGSLRQRDPGSVGFCSRVCANVMLVIIRRSEEPYFNSLFFSCKGTDVLLVRNVRARLVRICCFLVETKMKVIWSTSYSTVVSKNELECDSSYSFEILGMFSVYYISR